MVWQAVEPGELRRGRAGDAPPGRGARPGGRGRPPAQARRRRPARRRVRGPAAPARARPRRRVAAQRRPRSTALAALAARRLRRPRGRRDSSATAYRLLRTLEHRIQLYRLRRTHLMPDGRGATCAGSAGPLGHPRPTPAEAVRRASGAQHAARSAACTSELFYRPLLPAVARLSAAEARLTPEAAARTAGGARLPRPGRRAAAPRGAHRRASAGAPRSSARCCRSCSAGSPTSADPDAGLLAFRQVSDELGTTHWYLRLLRDEGVGRRAAGPHPGPQPATPPTCCCAAPEAVAMLGDAAGLQPRSREAPGRPSWPSAAARTDDPEPAVARGRARSAAASCSAIAVAGPRSGCSTSTRSGRR